MPPTGDMCLFARPPAGSGLAARGSRVATGGKPVRPTKLYEP